MKNILRILFISILIIGSNTSCDKETNNINADQTYLPSIIRTEPANNLQLQEIFKFRKTDYKQVENILDFESAISTVYEGYEEMEFVYIPSFLNDFTFEVYSFKEGKMLDYHLTIENHKNEMQVFTRIGSINFEIQNNLVVGAEVKYYSNLNSRIEGDCSVEGVAGGFLDCADEVVNQSRSTFGDVGGLLLDAACSLWVVCRGAVLVACSTMAVAKECIEE